MLRKVQLVSALALLALVIGCGQGGAADLIVGEPPQGVIDQMVPEPPGYAVTAWTQGLEIPWALAFMPDGRALVTERPGRIRLVERDGTLRGQPYATVDVLAVGEGGLLGLALHPSFPSVPYVYAFRTFSGPSGRVNQVIRLVHEGDTGRFDRVILDDIPAADYHNGGRIAFGPDGMLYIGAGDNFLSHLSQSLMSLAGKVLRITPEGAVPPDNPFPGSPIWSYGNRNPQGLAWHPLTGDLIETEHGPTGEVGDNAQAHDEVNVIYGGGNYGWPLAIGAPHRPEFTDPLVVWPGPSTPPSGITFWHGALFVATLRSQALIRIELQPEGSGYRVASIERWFAHSPDWGRFGRLRDVKVGPDDALYVLTNDQEQDYILRIAPTR